MSAPRQETRHRGFRHVAAGSARLPALYRLRTTLPARVKATAGYVELHGAERHPQRRYQLGAKGACASWLDEPRKHRCSGIGAARRAPYRDDQAGRQEGLQPLGGHAVPAGLRPEKDRSGRGFIHRARLDASKPNSTADAYGTSASELEARPQKQFGMPRHGTKSESSFRHGTKSGQEAGRIGDFVPPRNKTPRFSGLGCPATGHLSRYAICTEYGEGEVQR